MKLEINNDDLKDAADFMADINQFIADSKDLVVNKDLSTKEEFVDQLSRMTTLFDLLITAGTMQVETQLMIDEMEIAP